MELHAKDILAHGMQARSHSAQVQAFQQAQLARFSKMSRLKVALRSLPLFVARLHLCEAQGLLIFVEGYLAIDHFIAYIQVMVHCV